MSTTTPENQIILDAGKQIANLQNSIVIEGVPFALVPEQHKLEDLERLLDQPKTFRQRAEFTEIDSFIDYLNRFADQNTVITIDTENQKFSAVIDFHTPGGLPAWKRHTLHFALIATPEWNNWAKNNGKQLKQAEFGQFIEDNITDITDPSGAEMLEIALSLQAKTSINFESATRLDNGQTQFVYNEEIKGSARHKGQLKIPQQFSVGLQLFKGSQAYKLDARFKYRINEGKIIMWYELIRPHKTVDANMLDSIEQLKTKCSVKNIYFGTL